MASAKGLWWLNLLWRFRRLSNRPGCSSCLVDSLLSHGHLPFGSLDVDEALHTRRQCDCRLSRNWSPGVQWHQWHLHELVFIEVITRDSILLDNGVRSLWQGIPPDRCIDVELGPDPLPHAHNLLRVVIVAVHDYNGEITN